MLHYFRDFTNVRKISKVRNFSNDCGITKINAKFIKKFAHAVFNDFAKVSEILRNCEIVRAKIKSNVN